MPPYKHPVGIVGMQHADGDVAEKIARPGNLLRDLYKQVLDLRDICEEQERKSQRHDADAIEPKSAEEDAQRS